MNSSSSTIELLCDRIPDQVRLRSGKVFYSGRAAFEVQGSLYVLGVNPGGDPLELEAETVEHHTASVLHKFGADWSAYRDESWKGAAPGTSGMQPRVLHMFAALGLDPCLVPCSNLVFVRSRRESHMSQEMKSLLDLCWPFHSLAIEQLRPRAIVCFGKTAGRYVCSKLGATVPCAEFIERNNRRWRSHVFVSSTGLKVVVATHPSIADWCAPATDPMPLVREALEGNHD
jgi:uracil DNA glycosylase superfamily protein